MLLAAFKHASENIQCLGGSSPTERKGNYRIPKIEIKLIQVSCFMGVLSQRKHLVLGTLQRCHPRGQGGCKSRISSLKRASHLPSSYKNVCCLARSPLCFSLQQLSLAGLGTRQICSSCFGFSHVGKMLKQMMLLSE